MSENFESGLRDLSTRAAQAHDAGAGLPMAVMVGRARRRRALFDTGMTLAAAAVVGVLVLGAAAAGGLIDRDPVPPVQTPDETADPVAWDADYAPCGQTLEALGWQVDPAGSPMGTQVSVDSQALLTALAYLGTGQIDPDTIHRADSRADILAVDASSVVVGVLGISPDAPPEALEPPTEEILSLVTTAPLFSCRQQDGATRLEPGVYDLAIARDLQVLVDNAPADRRVIAVTPLTVPEPPAYDPEALPALLLDGQVPWCGEVFDVSTTGEPQMTVGLTQQVYDAATGEVAVTITLMNDVPGAGAFEIPVGYDRLVLTRDGVAVGFGAVGGDSGATLDPGTTRVLDTYVSPQCPGSEIDPETGLPPGDYELWAVVPLGESRGLVGGVAPELPNLVAGPWPYIMGDPDAVADPDPSTTAPAELPTCGESTEDLYATAGRVIGDATVKVGLLADVTTGEFLHEGYGDTLWVDTTLTNLGPDLYQTGRTVTEIVVAEDGVVVVTSQLDPADPSAGVWPGGETKESSGSITTTRCAGADPDILRHGEYTLWARTTVEWATEPDGPVQTWSVIDWPVDFWVYDFEDPDNQGPVTWTSSGPTT